MLILTANSIQAGCKCEAVCLCLDPVALPSCAPTLQASGYTVVEGGALDRLLSSPMRLKEGAVLASTQKLVGSGSKSRKGYYSILLVYLYIIIFLYSYILILLYYYIIVLLCCYIITVLYYCILVILILLP